MIRISNLIKEYPGGTLALKGISLDVKQGEFVVLLGSSGAGKSTLLRCINRLIKPTGGEIVVNGITVNDTRKNIYEVRKNVGMIFQQFNLVKRLSVLENVLCGRLAYSNVFASTLKLFSEEDISFALECLDKVGLTDKARRRADQLSGGQQQRVGIARALVQRPRVILADEPVASLDPKSAEHVLDILRNVCRKEGITMIVSLHNVELARSYGERAVGIKEGLMVLDKKACQITRPDEDYIYEQYPADGLKPGISVQAELVNA